MLPIRLRPTTLDDLDYVLQAESADENRPFVGQWSRDQHQAALTDPNHRHVILERDADQVRVGYLIFQGVADPNQTIQIRRLVVTEKGQGYGRMALKLAKAIAFDELHAHRLWLDVKTHNPRAQHLYRSEGFVMEGTLRECVKVGDRFESLIVLSILRPEYETSD